MATKRKSGMGYVMPNGYISVRRGEVRKCLHVWKAIDALGKDLPKGADVHHIDMNPANNENSNLVICPSRKYHKLLHIRTNALLATGDPNKRKCVMCGQYDDTAAMQMDHGRDETYRHRKCINEWHVNSRKMKEAA